MSLLRYTFRSTAGRHESNRRPSLPFQGCHWICCRGTLYMFAFAVSFCRLFLTSGERLRCDEVDVRAECRLADCNAIDTRQDINILVLSLDASLNTQHLLERVFIAMLYFKVLPFRPEGRYSAWIAEL